MAWRSMDTAPKDREIIVRRHNDIFHEHFIVWWEADPQYPWRSDYNAYPHERLDQWHEIPE